ncbi:hypothetical protein [Nocardioides sp.]|uniref:hypothetical protein n=1 Tax=Nocardioides sp. TaxID=35761 RepID=UPI002B2765B9|nr:hypothetical protein [Nocardioides sp.]
MTEPVGSPLAGPVETADRTDSYAAMRRLARLLDRSGAELRQRATLGTAITGDSAFVDSAGLSPRTHQEAHAAIRAATTGSRGLSARSIELAADALALQATVRTYEWIDDLQAAAHDSLGAIAGRAIGYLAPAVALGGALVSAGLIETDALDRDDVAGYLSELAESNPELMHHVTSGGGLVDGLQLRSLLTSGLATANPGPEAAAGGLRALGIAPLPVEAAAVLRDVAADVDAGTSTTPIDPDRSEGTPPRDLAGLLAELEATHAPVVIRRVGAGRWIVYLHGSAATGPRASSSGALRLATGDASDQTAAVVAGIEAVVADEPDARVMLVGAGQGGARAAEVAARAPSRTFVIEQVVTSGAPTAHVPRLPPSTRVLSLDDRSSPTALLGSLMNHGAPHRLTVVHDPAPKGTTGRHEHGGRIVDASEHPDLVAAVERLRTLGFLAR